MPPFRETPSGSRPPSCRYLWTASRPVNTTPLTTTASPTFSTRTCSSEIGVCSDIMCPLVETLLDAPVPRKRGPLPPICPAHVADAHEIRSGHAVDRADFHTEQRCLPAKPHGTDPELVGRLPDVLLQPVQFRHRISIRQKAEEL